MKVSRLLSCIGLGVVLLLGGCAPKSDPLAAAEQFFQQIAAGKTQEAYASAAFGFQAQQSEKVFAQTLKEMGLEDFASADWGAPELTGREARIPVTVQTKGGQALPIVVTLVEEAHTWRVYALRTPKGNSAIRSDNRFSLVGKGAAFTDALSRPVPDEAESKALASETVLLFNAAIQQKSFAEFYERVSLAWQTQLTQGQLQRAFQPFIDKEVDLSGIHNVKPILDPPPSINTEGLLLISGHYPTSPYKVFFALKFVYELPRWKLFGIDVNLQK